mgnify:CR=1 FL=1
MWTYLAIFFSLVVLSGVFIRKAFVLYKMKNAPVVEIEKALEKEISELEEAANEKITKSDQEKVEEFYQKGVEKLNIGKEDEAIKFFVQALAIHDMHIETQNKLAMLYMKKQMYSSAAVLFKSLGALTGEAVHYSHLGLALFQDNLLEEAKEAYQKAVEVDPERPQRFASLSQVYRALGQFQNAIIALNKAIELDQENMDFLFLLGEIQAENGNKEEAMEIFKRLREIDANNEEIKAAIKKLKE